MERWAEKVADQHGYTDVAHTLELFGTCSHCAR
jgi:Fur family ferric uptake transcriptional regulator